MDGSWVLMVNQWSTSDGFAQSCSHGWTNDIYLRVAFLINRPYSRCQFAVVIGPCSMIVTKHHKTNSSSQGHGILNQYITIDYIQQTMFVSRRLDPPTVLIWVNHWVPRTVRSVNCFYCFKIHDVDLETLWKHWNELMHGGTQNQCKWQCLTKGSQWWSSIYIRFRPPIIRVSTNESNTLRLSVKICFCGVSHRL